MSKHFLFAVISISLAVVPSAAVAGPDEDLRDMARGEASRLRAEGWPKVRCFVGVSFFKNVVAIGKGHLYAGDELLSVGDVNVENASTDSVAEAFGSRQPGEIIPLKIRRNGQVLNLTQECKNLADYHRPYLQALDYAGAKKWYDCIDSLVTEPDDALYISLRARCARVSRKAAQYPVQQWIDQAYRSSISASAYGPENWTAAASSLLKGRFDLSPSTYHSLVGDVEKWDNGKTWAAVQPNYAMLRRAAEQGVKARLIDPQSAIIEMPYDFIYGSWTPAFTGTRFEGFMTCGTVNAKNRMGGYTGATYFISVVDEAGYQKYTDMDSATAEYIRPVDNGCAQLVKKLKLWERPIQATETPSLSTSSKPSIAQELEKLAKLFASGALNEKEYSDAKAKILTDK